MLTRWWKTLPLAWYLDKRGHAELVTQRPETHGLPGDGEHVIAPHLVAQRVEPGSPELPSLSHVAPSGVAEPVLRRLVRLSPVPTSGCLREGARYRIEDVCQQSDHKPPVICTPNELMESDHAEDTEGPVIDELRAVRDAHAARCGYDVEKIFRDIRATQQASGREYVRLPARRVRSDAEDRATP